MKIQIHSNKGYSFWDEQMTEEAQQKRNRMLTEWKLGYPYNQALEEQNLIKTIMQKNVYVGLGEKGEGFMTKILNNTKEFTSSLKKMFLVQDVYVLNEDDGVLSILVKLPTLSSINPQILDEENEKLTDFLSENKIRDIERIEVSFQYTEVY